MIRSKVRKKGNDTNKMVRALQDLSSQVVQVGHFEEQGTHPTAVDRNGQPMSYVDLMEYHHKGNEEVPRRPILEILKIVKNPKASGPPYTAALNRWFKIGANKASNKQLLESFGEALKEEEQSIFGNPALLPVNPRGNPTPMLDTEATRDAVTYKIKRE